MVILETRTAGTNRKTYSEDANGKAGARNPWITNPVV